MRGRVPSIRADASGLHLKTKQKQKPFPPLTGEAYPIVFFSSVKTEAKFLFSNGSAFPIKVLCGNLGIVLLEPSNFLPLLIQILGEKKDRGQVLF